MPRGYRRPGERPAACKSPAARWHGSKPGLFCGEGRDPDLMAQFAAEYLTQGEAVATTCRPSTGAWIRSTGER